jgi:hypothetical protein
MADRRGLIEDRPKTIKIEILPCDNHDVDDALDELEAAGLISRYLGDNGVKTLKILKFLEHQRPHHTESDNRNLVEPGESACLPGESASEPALIPDSGFLIPDSCSLIPDTGFLIPDCGYPSPPTEGGTESCALSLPAPVSIPVREGDEPITQSEIDTWQNLYGNVQVLDTLRRMAGHWASKPANQRKTRKGIRTSINTWLAKDHDSARTGGPTSRPQFGPDGRADRARASMNEVLAELKGGTSGKRN